MRHIIDLTNKLYGRLTVLSREGTVSSSKKH